MFRILCVVSLFFISWGSAAQAMTSTNFGIKWDSINSGGLDVSTSTNYLVRDTLGDQAVGQSSSTNFTLQAGYRQGDTEATILNFHIGTEEGSTRIPYTAFNNAGKTVTVSSTSGFVAGDFIGVVENEGLLQLVAVGKIVSVLANDLTVDAWEGAPSSIGAIPSGEDDVVYRLNGSSADLGLLTTSLGKTSLTYCSVMSNGESGYTVYVNADGDLRTTTSTFILGVSDGAVTIGSEEYGGRVLGSTATGTASDFAISTTNREIQKSTTVAYDDRIALIYKAAISGTTAAGNYSQRVYYTVTANF